MNGFRAKQNVRYQTNGKEELQWALDNFGVGYVQMATENLISNSTKLDAKELLQQFLD